MSFSSRLLPPPRCSHYSDSSPLHHFPFVSFLSPPLFSLPPPPHTHTLSQTSCCPPLPLPVQPFYPTSPLWRTTFFSAQYKNMACTSLSRQGMWMIMLLCLAGPPRVSSQPGFVSIDCGGNTNYTAQGTGIRWTYDHGYTYSGNNGNTSIVNSSRAMQTVRYFPERKKNCYTVRVQAGIRYLVRSTFAYGNYDGKLRPPFFQLLIDATMITKINTTESVVYEIITFAIKETLSVCVARSDPTDTPFMSSLELRPLAENMYTTATENLYLSKVYRINFGARRPTAIRFPHDRFDRIWYADSNFSKQHKTWKKIHTNATVNTATSEYPPSVVMQTAVSSSDMLRPFLSLKDSPANYSIYIYLAEIQSQPPGLNRTFDIFIDRRVAVSKLNLSMTPGLLASYEHSEVFETISDILNISFLRQPLSKLGPILNAMELYEISPVESATFIQDANAVSFLKNSLNLLQWSGDPCRPYPWEWVTCSSTVPERIIKVNLSSMNLVGTINPAISNLTQLTDLWLDHNHLTGFIPDLSQLKELQTLHLQDNDLRGLVPQTLANLPNLRELFLTNNNLTGILPLGLENRSNLISSFWGNPSLCTSTGVCFSSPVASKPTSKPPKSMRRTKWVLIGSMVGSFVVTSILVTMFTYFILQSRRKGKMLKANEALKNGSLADSSYKTSTRILNQVRLFGLEEIACATCNFQRKIGEGSFGQVYYGRLDHGKDIAVKVQAKNSPQGEREFLSEVEFLSRVHHRNIVDLIGYYHASDKRMLLYEYMPGGTLEDCLHANEPAQLRPLLWRTRLSIALDAAKGLVYLHYDCNPSIIHRDVKSCNILLTDKLTAKLADFGLSRLGPEDGSTHVTTVVRGTSGYLDPEYYDTEKLTQKSDVYSFGVVLLEIISGQEPLICEFDRSFLKLSDWARDFLKKGKIEHIVDPHLGNKYKTETMWKVAELAMSCVEPCSKHRPNMLDVYQTLQDAMVLEQGEEVTVADPEVCNPEIPLRPNHSEYHYSQPVYLKRSLSQSLKKSSSKNRRTTAPALSSF